MQNLAMSVIAAAVVFAAVPAALPAQSSQHVTRIESIAVPSVHVQPLRPLSYNVGAAADADAGVDATSYAMLPASHPLLHADTQRIASRTEVALGSTLGWALGLAAGVGVGYLIEPSSGESYFGASEWWIGGWIGSSIGSAVGAHLANSRRGSLPLGVLGTLAAAPVAIIAAPVLTPLVVPPVQIGVSVFIERRTAARRGP